jgi:hypothetical protein
MRLDELVRAILDGDLLRARQWVSDAYRSSLSWERLELPEGLSEREVAVTAGIAELLASRVGAKPPIWTATLGGLHEPLVLDPGLEKMPRSFARARRDGPEPLRKRNLVAPPDFLAVI